MTLPEVTILEATGSTNDDMIAAAREGAPHGTAEATHLQTAGRGRRGHVWQSPEGGLYLSIVLRPDVPMQLFSGLPAVCALGCSEALSGLGAEGIALKWPNDVIVGRRKLAGLLVEGGYGEGGTFAVVGIGINVVPADGLEADLGDAHDGSARPLSPAYLVDCFDEGELPPFEDIATAVRDGVIGRVDRWAADVAAGRAQAGPLAPVLSDYFDAIPMLGEQVEALLPDGQVFLTGRFAGIDVWGKATVVTPEGAEMELSAEQASLRTLS